MTLRLLPLVLVLAFGLPATISAATSKLDPRARIALARLRAGLPAARLAAEGAAVDASGALDVFISGEVSRETLEALGVRVRSALPGVYTAFLPAGAVEAVAALPGVRAIEGAPPVELQLDLSVPTTHASAQRGPPPGFAGLNGAGVLICDVDTGIDYDHADFRDENDLSRVLAVWDQWGPNGTPPPEFSYGSEWLKPSLDDHTALENDLSGHGTHVMGIAAGDGSGTGGGQPVFQYTGMAPRADLLMVAVKLTSTAIVDGVTYCMNRATSLGRNAVVNLSLGTQYGPHDGSSPFERAISALTGPGRLVTVSCGNDRGLSIHAEAHAAGPDSTVQFFVATPNLGSFFDIAGYYQASETLSVWVRGPYGETFGPVSLGQVNAGYPGAPSPHGTVYIENGVTETGNGDRILYIEISQASGQSISGGWTIGFVKQGLGPTNGLVDLWKYFGFGTVQFVFGRGNQPDRKLITEPSCADSVISVAAWTTRQEWTDCAGTPGVFFSDMVLAGNLCPFSSPGPTRTGGQRPDLTAPGSAIASSATQDVIWSCITPSQLLGDGWQHVTAQGTSMAAPHVAGALALLMQKYGAITPSFARAYLRAHAAPDGFTGATWNKDWGMGKLALGDLTDPVAHVLSPNGGETLVVGDTASIQWNAADAYGGIIDVDVLLSRGGPGGPWEPLAADSANLGQLSWVATEPRTTHALLRVIARDAAGNTGADTSDAEFAVDTTTATVLALFEAEPRADGIVLRWRFADPGAFAEVRLERGESAAGGWAPVGAERHDEGETIVVLDAAVEPGRRYWYRLVARDRDGRVSTFGPLEATAGVTLADGLAPVAPNPTDGEARVEFTLARAGAARVSVVDVQGREVALLADGWQRAGRHQLAWSGEGKSGPVPAGLYFVRCRAEGKTFTRRVAVIR